MLILLLLLSPFLSAMTIEQKYEKLSRVPYIGPESVYVKSVEPSGDVHTEYDEYINQYRQLGFQQFQSDPEYSWTFFLEGNVNTTQYQSYYMHLKEVGELKAEISRLYEDTNDIQPPGFDFYVSNSLYSFIISIQDIQQKLSKYFMPESLKQFFKTGTIFQFLEIGQICMQRKDSIHKRIKFESKVTPITHKLIGQKNIDPLDSIVQDLSGINSNIRNFMTHHTQDLAQSNIHSRMQNQNFLKQYGYAILQVFVIFALNVAQLMYIKRLFSSTKVLI